MNDYLLDALPALLPVAKTRLASSHVLGGCVLNCNSRTETDTEWNGGQSSEKNARIDCAIRKNVDK